MLDAILCHRGLQWLSHQRRLRIRGSDYASCWSALELLHAHAYAANAATYAHTNYQQNETDTIINPSLQLVAVAVGDSDLDGELREQARHDPRALAGLESHVGRPGALREYSG